MATTYVYVTEIVRKYLYISRKWQQRTCMHHGNCKKVLVGITEIATT
jgi:hypothetical protein